MKHNIHEGLPTNHHFPGVHHLQTVIQKMFFCQNVDHYRDKSNILTEIDKRRQLLKRNRLCFNCLGVVIQRKIVESK